MLPKRIIPAIAIAAMGVASCSHLPFGKDNFEDSHYTGSASTASTSSTTARASGAGHQAAIEERQQSPAIAGKQVFYFGFDNSTVARNDYTTVREQARYLASHPEAKLVVDGHTDERGAREYNLALGERRANSVAELLRLQGANPRQIEVITHGQEKPVALGHNEDAWRLNRRVEINVKNYG